MPWPERVLMCWLSDEMTNMATNASGSIRERGDSAEYFPCDATRIARNSTPWSLI